MKIGVVKFPPEVYKYKNLRGAMPSGVVPLQLVKLEQLKEGGLLSYFNGCAYPMRGHIDHEALAAVNLLKKYIHGWLRVLSSPFIIPFLFPLIIPYIFRKVWERWFSSFARYCRELMHPFCFERKYVYAYYSEPVMAIYGIAEDMGLIGKNNLESEIVVESICISFENDVRYRWILQDVLQEVNFEKLLHSPAREVKKATDVFLSRLVQDTRGWKGISAFAYLLVLFQPNVRRFIKTIARKVLEHKCQKSFALTEEDLYFCLGGDDYNFLGLKKEERVVVIRQLVERKFMEEGKCFEHGVKDCKKCNQKSKNES